MSFLNLDNHKDMRLALLKAYNLGAIYEGVTPSKAVLRMNAKDVIKGIDVYKWKKEHERSILSTFKVGLFNSQKGKV